MLADEAVDRMRAPKFMSIICIDVTNKCDLACSNCTRLLANQDRFWEMAPVNFRLALRSLVNFPGIIAMLGGNPCMHREFEYLCEIFREEIPNKMQRGLWTNNVFKYGKLAEETFGALNLNPHANPRAIDALRDLYNATVALGKANGAVYDGRSKHAPLLTAVKDLYPEPEMWARIANCDINKNWSASIVENKGELAAYFCEVAASFDLARNTNHGLPVTLDWWKAPMQAFADQVKRFCPGCGAPARLEGTWDNENTDTYTLTNGDIAVKTLRDPRRKAKILTGTLERSAAPLTKYNPRA